MNQNHHLNIFHAYTKVKREQQLENDLTRALAICLQEDTVYLHEILKFITNHKEGVYDSLFSDSVEGTAVQVGIQQNISVLSGFNTLFAVSISGCELQVADFFHQTHNTLYDPKPDLIITVNDVAIIMEVKPDDQHCIAQLYNQAWNAFNQDRDQKANQGELRENIIPVDLNWKKLMELTLKIIHFQRSLNQHSRFLNDFVTFVRGHNHTWLPATAIANLDNSIANKLKFEKRISACLGHLAENHEILDYYGRIGLKLDVGWAQEIVLNINRITQKAENDRVGLFMGIWPGNTKAQGSRVLNILEKNRGWKPPETISICGTQFDVRWGYEIKFCHFNAYVTNLVIKDRDIKPGKKILSPAVHHSRTGKYERDTWPDLEGFLDEYLINDFDWKSEIGWEYHFVNTGRKYLTMSIGYEIEIVVPIDYLKQLDIKTDNLEPLSQFIVESKKQLTDIFNL